MASMLEEMRRMAGLESRWPEYTLGEDKLTPLEQHILKKLKTKPTSADDLAWDAPGESLPKDIDKALAHLKKLGKVQAVKQDDEWTWKLLEEYDPHGMRWAGPLERIYIKRGDGPPPWSKDKPVELTYWHAEDSRKDKQGKFHYPDEADQQDQMDSLTDALNYVQRITKLSAAERKKIEDGWDKNVEPGEEYIAVVLYFEPLPAGKTGAGRLLKFEWE